MSLGAVLSNALSGLAVAQNALAVTANNVANANTEGYSRQVPQQEALVIAGRGAGARSLPTTRLVDELLGARLRDQLTRLGYSETLGSVHEQIQERVFGAPGDADRGLGSLITRAAAAAEGFAANPGQLAAAQGLIGAAQDLARGIEAAGAEVQGLRRELDQRIAATTASINGDLLQLAELNAAFARGGAGAELLDRRDTLLADLAGKLDTAISVRDDGAVAIYTRAGIPLLDGEPHRLHYAAAATVGRDTGFGAIRSFRSRDVDPITGEPVIGAQGTVLVSGGVRTLLTPELAADSTPDAAQVIGSTLRGGQLEGLLEARDLLLPSLADQLGELAESARFALNAAHNSATPQPPSTALSGSRTDTGAFATGVRSGLAFLAVIDQATGMAAVTVPVDMAAAADAVGLAGQISAALGAFGTASIAADGRLQLTTAAGYGLAVAEGDSSVGVVDAAGRSRSFGFAHFFGLNDLLVGSSGDPTRLRVREDLAANPRLLSRSRLDVQPGPPISSALGGVGDDRGARALAAAFVDPIATVARGDLPAGSFRLVEYAAEIVAVRAGTANRAESAAATDRALADDLVARRAATSGVNLDEELSRLVLYQEAYSVSARLISITNQLFDELLAIAG